jgi:hypothetical protein
VLKAFEFLNRPLQFGDQSVRIPFQKNIKDCTVVPESALSMAAETPPHGIAFYPIVGEDGAHVVELVGSTYEANVVAGFTQEREKVELALFPGRLGDRVCVGAPLHYRGDTITEARANFFEHRMAATIFDDIVQQAGDGLVFVASSLEDQRGHRHQVRNVRHTRALAGLASVLFGGKIECFAETWAE